MTYALITPPAAEPLTLAETKAHLRLDGADEDALVTSLARTAREHLEHTAGLCLMTQTWRLYLDAWPKDGMILIGKGPVQTIDRIVVYDVEGQPSNLPPATDSLLDGAARPARLWLRAPNKPGRAMNGIEIDFKAGFSGNGAEVPDTLKRAMLIHVAHMFALRGAIAPQDQPAGVPAGYERLIAPFCLRGL